MKRLLVVLMVVAGFMLSSSPVSPVFAVVAVAGGAAVLWAARPVRGRT